MKVEYEKIKNQISKRLSKVEGPVIFNSGELADSLAMDHLTGTGREFIPWFGNTENGYLFMLTKSDNVDDILDLDHKGRTIIAWSMNNDAVSRKFEIGAPTFKRRLDAAEKVQKVKAFKQEMATAAIESGDDLSDNKKNEIDPEILERAEQLSLDPEIFKKRINTVNSLGIINEQLNIGVLTMTMDSRLNPMGIKGSNVLAAKKYRGRVIAEISDYALAYQLVDRAFRESLGGGKYTDRRIQLIDKIGPVTPGDLAKIEGVSGAAITSWSKNWLEKDVLIWCDELGVGIWVINCPPRRSSGARVHCFFLLFIFF